jgi:hypothetical protein
MLYAAIFLNTVKNGSIWPEILEIAKNYQDTSNTYYLVC